MSYRGDQSIRSRGKGASVILNVGGRDKIRKRELNHDGAENVGSLPHPVDSPADDLGLGEFFQDTIDCDSSLMLFLNDDSKVPKKEA